MLKRTTLRSQVVRQLQDEIRLRHKPGDRLETELQLAKRLGVSLITVKEALGQLSHEGLIDRRQGKGTFVSVHRPKPALGRIALISDIDAERIRESTFFLPLLRRVEEHLATSGRGVRYYFGLGPGPGTPAADGFLADLQNGLVDGVVAAGLTNRPEFLAAFDQAGVPVVATGGGFASGAHVDFRTLLTDALNELASRGCRHVGLLTGTAEDGVHLGAQRVIADGTVRLSVASPQGWSPQEVVRRITTLFDTDPALDSLLVADDFWLAGVQAAVSGRGLRMPDDLLLAILHNQGASDPAVPCLLMEIDTSRIADLLHRQLLAWLDGTGRAELQLVPGRLRYGGGLGTVVVRGR